MFDDDSTVEAEEDVVADGIEVPDRDRR